MKKIVFDIEADNLLKEATVIHCLVAKDIDSKEVFTLQKSSLVRENILDILGNACIIGHNIIDYDLPMLRKFFDISFPMDSRYIIDTCLWSRVWFPDLELPDGCPTSVPIPGTKKSRKIFPHSLEAWGYRLGEQKIEVHEWHEYNPLIAKRCLTDVEINEKILYAQLKVMKFTLEEYFEHGNNFYSTSE